jgi:hypothetical protein
MNHFTTKFWIGSCVAALIVLLLSTPFAIGQTPSPNGNEVILSGFLSCTLEKDSPRQCPFRLHYVNLNQGSTYIMRIESTEFDARLLLENLEGKLLAANYDWVDEDLFGCIVFRAPTTGSYRLVVSAAPRLNEGFYTVMLRELPVVMRVEAALTTSDAALENCFHKAHEISLVAGRRYIIDLESNEFETCVKLMNAEGAIIAFADEGNPDRLARLVFEAPRTGTYRLVAASNTPYAVGAFRLTVCGE